ncbi:DNA polymerase III subunit delta [Nitrincola sp.]|uniref:DNA polymerase III subunit delta n=1 Tax=Nitrincola sp. TaxID=1926584 RepID=UPI003A9572BD
MKLRTEQLPGALQRFSASPVFMVIGDEPLQSQEAADQIRAYLRQQGFSERDVHQSDSHFSWETTLLGTNELSLFADRKIVEIRLGSHKINKGDGQLLLTWLKDPPPDTALLLIMEKADAASRKAAWFKHLEAEGLLVEVHAPDAAQLPQWLSQRAISQGMQLNDEALQVLAERIEGNLLAAHQELAKLQLLFPGTQISAEQVIASVSDSSRYDVFALTEAALSRQPERCEKILTALIQEGLEAPVVLWALTREIRTLYNVQLALQQGQQYDNLCQKERIWGKRKALVRKASQNLASTTLESLLKSAALADHAIKGMTDQSPWLIIRQIALKLAGVSLLPTPEVL